MSSRSKERERHIEADKIIDFGMEPAHAMATAPDALTDRLVGDVIQVFASQYPTEIERQAAMVRHFFRHNWATAKERDNYLDLLKRIKFEKPVLGQVLSDPFVLNGDSQGQKFVYARELRESATILPYAVVEVPGSTGAARPPVELPHIGFLQLSTQTYLGPCAIQPPPMKTEICGVVAVHETQPGAPLTLELEDGIRESTFTVFTRRSLGESIKTRLDDGEVVHVRVAVGEAIAIHQVNSSQTEDWLEFLDLDPALPGLRDLVFTAHTRAEWERDLRTIIAGRGQRIVLIGSTGLGKSEGVARVGRDAFHMAAREGKHFAGVALLRLSSATIGSYYIHHTERRLFAAYKKARELVKRNYIVVVLLDEADAWLSEANGPEHRHSLSERRGLQDIFSRNMPGISTYLTMNAHPFSALDPAIARRFYVREYGRPSRRQIEKVGAYYMRQHDAALRAIGLSAEEAGAAIADNLFADGRILAKAHLHSGAVIDIRARDLCRCCPAKVEDLVTRFCHDVEDGISHKLSDLWPMLDTEFQSNADINSQNLWTVTFCKPPVNDSLKTLERV
ncbi:MAG: hypothetical protein C0404_05945 [Verrucomicrobia bacterium]|nr:hypothetical protein [Verrucomicrobiota bacterium]